MYTKAGTNQDFCRPIKVQNLLDLWQASTSYNSKQNIAWSSLDTFSSFDRIGEMPYDHVQYDVFPFNIQSTGFIGLCGHFIL